jgi:iron complex transport system ATP-binding protein
MQLSVENLAFGYRDKTVGSKVSFTLDAGEVLCLLGPNGAGKTTLFKTILGLLAPLDGAVRADGAPIHRWSRQELARLFGYVPQAQPGFFPFTVSEVVLMGRTARIGLFQSPSATDLKVADELLGLLGIHALADRPYTEVSGGERQLALIARALAQEPKVLVMDEPTASLDFGNQVRVLSEIKTLANRGIAVILSTHDPDQAFLCAQRVAILHRGGLAHVGTPTAVITPPVLRAVYGVEVEIAQVESSTGEKHSICVPSLARPRSALGSDHR